MHCRQKAALAISPWPGTPLGRNARSLRTGDLMLAFFMALIAGRSYRWRPDIDVSNSFVFTTLFADGGH
jgi:hypothetical protein